MTEREGCICRRAELLSLGTTSPGDSLINASRCNRGYSSQWDVFFDQIQPLGRAMPYMTLIGNHERDWPGSGDRYPNGVIDSGAVAERGSCGTMLLQPRQVAGSRGAKV